MKLKILLATVIVALISACSPSAEQESQTPDQVGASDAEERLTDVETPSAIKVTEASVIEAQLEDDLSKLGCFACHAVDEERIGPTYRSIAVLYRQADAKALLVNKVINGGGGIWGPMPMISHPHLTPEILNPLIERILALPGE